MGKMKRIRDGLPPAFQADMRAAMQFVTEFIAALKATGLFDPGSGQYAGAPTIQAAQAAMAALGLKLEASGDCTQKDWEALKEATFPTRCSPMCVGSNEARTTLL